MSFLTRFLGEGSPTKIDYRKKGYPYSDPSTEEPRIFSFFNVFVNQGFSVEPTKSESSSTASKKGTPQFWR